MRTNCEGDVQQSDGDGREYLITWVPDELLEKMDKEDREGYKRVDARVSSVEGAEKSEEDGGCLACAESYV